MKSWPKTPNPSDQIRITTQAERPAAAQKAPEPQAPPADTGRPRDPLVAFPALKLIF